MIILSNFDKILVRLRLSRLFLKVNTTCLSLEFNSNFFGIFCRKESLKLGIRKTIVRKLQAKWEAKSEILTCKKYK